MRKSIALLALAAMTACSSASDAVNADVSVATLESSTAKYFGTSAQNVIVSKYTPGVLGTEYKAKVGGRDYYCRYFQSNVNCVGAERTRGSGFSY